jgi:hypothetical protein
VARVCCHGTITYYSAKVSCVAFARLLVHSVVRLEFLIVEQTSKQKIESHIPARNVLAITSTFRFFP